MSDADAQEDGGIDCGELVYALSRLATGFESADPHIRHEAKAVAKQNIGQLALEVDGDDVVTDGGQVDGEINQVYSEVRDDDWMDMMDSEFVDYVEGVRSFGLVFDHGVIGLHGIKFDTATGALKPVSFEKNE